MHYRGRISHILPAQDHFPDAVFNDHLSPQDARATSQFYENTYPPYQTSSHLSWEYLTTTLDTGSPGFESALGDLNGQVQIRPVLSPELPSTIRPILPSTSSSATFPFNAQPPFLDGSATFLDSMSTQPREVSHNSGREIQLAHGHQIRQPGCPRAYVADGLLVDEEDLVDENTNNGCIHVHACNRKDSHCGLWVKADRRSIMRHGQRWHGDARSGGDRSITCPWLGCNRQMQANAIPRHTLSAHFGATWTCRGTGCSKIFNRHDSFKAHAGKRGCLGAIVTYDADTRVINTQNVLRRSG
ncbi:hypothetical protein BD769DRAFT_236244 [Suillus cothurnatus]|nr:hypothetical protein BD769DRAFT_236244 [Suillus cothurnatus]